MKLILFLMLLGLAGADASAFPPDSVKKAEKLRCPQEIRSVTKTNPLAMLWGPIPLTSEFKILQEFTTHPFQSLQVGFSVLRKSPFLLLFEDTLTAGTNDHYVVKGWRFQIAKRYYMQSTYYSPYGIYISPSFSISSAKISTELALRSGYFLKATHYNASILVGAQPILFDLIAVDVFGGLGIQDKIWQEHNVQQGIVKPLNLRDLGMMDWPVKITAGFSIGLAM